jgi:hypothetical protein
MPNGGLARQQAEQEGAAQLEAARVAAASVCRRRRPASREHQQAGTALQQEAALAVDIARRLLAPSPAADRHSGPPCARSCHPGAAARPLVGRRTPALRVLSAHRSTRPRRRG